MFLIFEWFQFEDIARHHQVKFYDIARHHQVNYHVYAGDTQ